MEHIGYVKCLALAGPYYCHTSCIGLTSQPSGEAEEPTLGSGSSSPEITLVTTPEALDDEDENELQ